MTIFHTIDFFSFHTDQHNCTVLFIMFCLSLINFSIYKFLSVFLSYARLGLALYSIMFRLQSSSVARTANVRSHPKMIFVSPFARQIPQILPLHRGGLNLQPRQDTPQPDVLQVSRPKRRRRRWVAKHWALAVIFGFFYNEKLLFFAFSK